MKFLAPDWLLLCVHRDGTRGEWSTDFPWQPAMLQVNKLAIGNTYYFVVTAVDTPGNERPRSVGVSKSNF